MLSTACLRILDERSFEVGGDGRAVHVEMSPGISPVFSPMEPATLVPGGGSHRPFQNRSQS